MAEIDYHDLPKNDDGSVCIDYEYDGTMYSIKILDNLDRDPDIDDTKSRYVNAVILAKKSSSVNWRLLYIHVLNYRIEQDELLYCDFEIHIDADNYSIIAINEKKSKLLMKMCNNLMDNLPDDISGTPYKVSYRQLINYFYQWFAQKRTIEEIASCEIKP